MKPVCVFVIENKLGGVAYLNKNLVNFSSLRHQFHVRVILVCESGSGDPEFTDTLLADEIIKFRYSVMENKYSVLKRLAKLFGPEEGAIICNDGLEMEAIYHFGTAKTVYQVIHDFYNLKLSVYLGAITDVFLAHTRLFTDVLYSADPGNTQCFYVPHGVPISAQCSGKASENLRLVFVGRLVESKGCKDLITINKILREKKIHVDWTIIGRGPLKDELLQQWSEESNVTFMAPETNEEVLKVMSEHDIFVLPTTFEGSPVTILEAISVGLVPVVSDLPGGIREIVTDEVGKTVEINNPARFAGAIGFFHENRGQLEKLKSGNRALALREFDIRVTSDNYFRLFLKYKELKKRRSALPKLNVGYRLDSRWIPNALVKFSRQIKKSL